MFKIPNVLNQEYFDKILTSKNFKAELLLALGKDSGVTIGGSLFVTTKNIVQYHLGATKNEFLDVMPAKLLLDEMRIIATKRGRQFFNLGGGLGGVHNDSLFNFKSSFSKYFKQMYSKFLPFQMKKATVCYIILLFLK